MGYFFRDIARRLRQRAEILTPSYHGGRCLHNGKHRHFEIACDNCDHFQECFPEHGELMKDDLPYER